MTRSEIFNVLKTNLELVVEGAQGQQISEQASMRDYGADSLELVEIVSRCMKQLKIKVSRVDLSQAKNIGDLIDLFEKAQSIPPST